MKTDKAEPQAAKPEKTATKETELEAKTDQKSLAKAGKRSAKALAEDQLKKAKEERKATIADSSTVAGKKPTIKTPRTRLERAGKKYREAAKQVDKNKSYSLPEAAELAVKTSTVTFDATIEMHINLNVDPKQADQNIREMVSLPAGSGKSLKVAVLAEAGDAEKAKKAGADFAGSDELFAKLEKEDIDFDILISTPAMMARLSKYARLLGPKGLMPNPKSGTVAPDVAKAVKEAKAGKVEYRVDSNGIIHLGVGKVSFGAEKLAQNAEAVLASVKSAKPASVKGTYINSLYLSSTMGPPVRVEV